MCCEVASEGIEVAAGKIERRPEQMIANLIEYV